ncbi:hypothetical protein HDU87_001901 [Geranomyces variabilis]|uniref:Uncharacterized protein n=1 Tax=Geranomyces variabilis TaxID=109894 RepID=A0AAD5TGH9_9FUNG|nr:hypothetical protein HDU87_001901 [Geranomyces variabilis]
MEKKPHAVREDGATYVPQNNTLVTFEEEPQEQDIDDIVSPPPDFGGKDLQHVSPADVSGENSGLPSKDTLDKAQDLPLSLPADVCEENSDLPLKDVLDKARGKSGIVDLNDEATLELLGPATFKNIHTLSEKAQTFQSQGWDYFETTVGALQTLDRVTMTSFETLANICANGLRKGLDWMLEEIFSDDSKQRRPKARSLARTSKLSPQTTHLVPQPPHSQLENSRPAIDADIAHILFMLIRCYQNVQEQTCRTLSERDGDATFYWLLLEILKPRTNVHYGEVMSRASRQRRLDIARRQDPDNEFPNIRGAFLDYLFCRDDHHSEIGWGAELGAAANAGMKRDDSKHVSDRKGLATVLRDMHHALAKHIQVGDFDDSIIRHLPIHGLLLQHWAISHVIVTYISGGYYAVQTIHRAQIPTRFDQNFGHFFSEALELILCFRDGVACTREILLAHDSGLPATDEWSDPGNSPPDDYIPCADYQTPSKKRRS